MRCIIDPISSEIAKDSGVVLLDHYGKLRGIPLTKKDVPVPDSLTLTGECPGCRAVFEAELSELEWKYRKPIIDYPLFGNPRLIGFKYGGWHSCQTPKCSSPSKISFDEKRAMLPVPIPLKSI